MQTAVALPKEFDPVSDALSGYSALVSSTPQAFDAKVKHMPAERRARTGVILVDVLRATSTLVAAAAAGSRGVHLAVKPEAGAYDLHPPFGASEEWVYGGEDNGRAIPGGRIGNSPLEVCAGTVGGRYLKFFSTNGARAVAAVEKSDIGGIFLASLANIEATAVEAMRRGHAAVWFVCGGFYGASTLEDVVCAGRGIQALRDRNYVLPNGMDDEARIAINNADTYDRDDAKLLTDLRGGQVNTLLSRIGHGTDLDAVVCGSGMDDNMWQRMATTVLVGQTVSGTFMFVPERSGAQS